MKNYGLKLILISSILFTSSLFADLEEMKNMGDAKKRIDNLVAALNAEVTVIDDHIDKISKLDVTTLPKNDADAVPNNLKDLLEPLSNEYNVGIVAEDVDF